MSKSARSQSFPRSQKPLVVKNEGFFAKLKRRLRISSKKSYSIGESLDGISNTGHYASRSSIGSHASQTTDSIAYSDMGHNIACSMEPSSPNGNSIVRVRAESCRNETQASSKGVSRSADKTLHPGPITQSELPPTPTPFSVSSVELENQFVIPEESAVDLDDNVFTGASIPASMNRNVSEILEEPGYETLEDIRSQIKELDKKSGSCSIPNSAAKPEISVKTDDSKSGNIRGQMSKTSLDSGLGSPEQGTQSPNLDSECDSSESITSGSGVKVCTETVRSFHTVQGTPQVEIVGGTDDDIYANAQIPMRKKSVKKSQSEPNNVGGDGSAESVTQTADSASPSCTSGPVNRGSANPPPLPDRLYSVIVDENAPLVETKGNTTDPPPLPIRKYSTSDLDESGISVGMAASDGNGNFPDSSSSDTCTKVSQTKNGQKNSMCKCGKDFSSCSCASNKLGPVPKLEQGSSKQSSKNLPDKEKEVDNKNDNKKLTEKGESLKGKSRLGSRRNDKTVVEVRFGSVKLKEEVGEASDKCSLISEAKCEAESLTATCTPGNCNSNVGAEKTQEVQACTCKCESAEPLCKLCSGKVGDKAQEVKAGTKQDRVCADLKPVPATTSKRDRVDRPSVSTSQQPRTLTGHSSAQTDPKTSANTVSVSSSSVVVHSVIPRSTIAQTNTASSTPVAGAENSVKPNPLLLHSVKQPATDGPSTSVQKSNSTSSASAKSVTPTAAATSATCSAAEASNSAIKASDSASASAMGAISSALSNAQSMTLPGLSLALNRTDGAQKTHGAESGDVPPPTTSRTIRCNSMDPDVLFRDDEPIHMSLQEVFAQGDVQSSIALAERIARRRSRLQIDSEDILAFQESMQQLKECGWYWGPLSSTDAELKLANKPNGSFLVRDSANENYILSITFKSSARVHHTRIEHFKGKFSFWSQPESHGKNTIKEFIEQAMDNSRNGQFKYFLRAQGPGMPPVSMYLLYPVSRFRTMRSLMHMCRFTILQLVRRDHVDCLPIPLRIKNYLKEHQYYAENIDDEADDIVGFDKNDNQTMTHL